MVKTLILMLIILGPLGSAQADTCKSVDLKNKTGPIRDQLDTPWCFAFSTADLVTSVTGATIAPYPIALNTHNSIEKKETACGESLSEGGSFSDAFSVSNIRGFCRESDVKTFDQKILHKRSAIRQLKLIQDRLIEIRADLAATCSDRFGIDVEQAVKRHGSDLRAMFEENRLSNLVPTSSLKDILEVLASPSLVVLPEEALQQVMQAKCDLKVPYDLKTTEKSEVGESALWESLNTQLDRSNVVGLSVNLFPFLELNEEVWRKSERGLCSLNEVREKKFAGHALTLVGREYDAKTRSCEYIVKNSWGKSCESAKRFLPKIKCRNGFLYLGEKEMRAMLFSTSHLEPVRAGNL